MKHEFWDAYAYGTSPLHALDARIKILGLLAGVLAVVSTPAPSFAAFAAFGILIVALLVISGLPRVYFCKRLLIVLPFIIMTAAFSPFLSRDLPSGGISLGLAGPTAAAHPALVVWNVSAKAFESAALAILLTSTTPFPALLNGLTRLRVPKVLVMLLSFTYRYLFVLIEEFQKMRVARDSRGFRGRWIWQATTVGHMVAAIFLRSYERAERIYLAMISRGYTGSFPYLLAPPLRLREGALLAGFLFVLLMIRIVLA